MFRLLSVFITILLSISGSATAIAPTCDSVVYQLDPCLSYLVRTEAMPPTTCCSGVKNLKQYSNDKSARLAICQCLVETTRAYAGIDYSLIPGLPRKCGVAVKLPAITPGFDCSKV